MSGRWEPGPERRPEPWPAGGPPGLPGWLEEKLFDQRVVMLRGPLTGAQATQVAAVLLALDARGGEPVQLHVASPEGELSAAFALIDAMESMRAPVHAVVTAQAGGAVVGVLAAADRRSAYRHARIQLSEPRATSVTGTADVVTAAAGQHLRELEELVLRIVAVTGHPRSRVEDDLSTGRVLGAEEAVAYRIVDAIVGDDR